MKKMVWKRRICTAAALSCILAGAALIPGYAEAAGQRQTDCIEAWNGCPDEHAAAHGCRGRLLETMSQMTGLSREQILEQRRSGKSLADIAMSKGVTEDQLVNAVIQEKKSFLNEKVEQGKITATQRDALLSLMRDRLVNRLKDKDPVGKQSRGH